MLVLFTNVKYEKVREMLRIIVDSGSSIKQSEREKYGVDIIPLKIMFDEQEYLDGVDISNEFFYHKLVEEKKFPKTSLPSLQDTENLVNRYTEQGDEVIIITISSGISGTYQSMKMLFEQNPRVRIIDSLTAVGGIRILVEEANRHRDESLDEIVNRLQKLIPKIRIMAIPEKLDYLLMGGRLSKSEWMMGSLLSIKPVIGIRNGNVEVWAKKMGLKNSMSYIVSSLEEQKIDTNYGIVAAYTNNRANVEKLIEMTPPQYAEKITAYDDLDLAIACHWGPNAFGYIYVSKEDYIA